MGLLQCLLLLPCWLELRLDVVSSDAASVTKNKDMSSTRDSTSQTAILDISAPVTIMNVRTSSLEIASLRIEPMEEASSMPLATLIPDRRAEREVAVILYFQHYTLK